jgi:hypothetical protein
LSRRSGNNSLLLEPPSDDDLTAITITHAARGVCDCFAPLCRDGARAIHRGTRTAIFGGTSLPKPRMREMQKSRYDQPLRKLRQARDELRQDYSRIRHDLARLEKMIAQLESMNHGAQGDAARQQAVDALHEITSKDIEGLSHAQAATLILSKASSPMTIRQLLDVFERAGRKFSAKNGYGILHKSLRNHKQFDSVAGKWRLVVNGFHPAPEPVNGSGAAAG